MEAMRQSWTDDRLDAFRVETQRRFDEVDRRFGEVDRRLDEVGRRLDEVGRRLDKVEGEVKELGHRMEARFDAMSMQFASLQRSLLRFSGALVVALLGVIVTQL